MWFIVYFIAFAMIFAWALVSMWISVEAPHWKILAAIAIISIYRILIIQFYMCRYNYWKITGN